MALDLGKLIVAIIICEMAGVIGAMFTSHNIASWYEEIAKPGFAPSGTLIGGVWVFLYALMGISLYLIWDRCASNGGNENGKGTMALTLFGIQLAVNSAWSFLFFELRSPFAGLVGIAFLWVLIVATIVKTNEVCRNAALLLLPYLAWVTFAGYLNFLIWQLNPY